MAYEINYTKLLTRFLRVWTALDTIRTLSSDTNMNSREIKKILLSRASLAGRNFFVSGRSIANPDIFEKYSVQFVHFWAYPRSSSKSGAPKVGSELVEYS